MKTLLLGLTFFVMSPQIFAQSTLSGIVIQNPVGVRADGTTGPVPFNGPVTYSTDSNTQFNVTTQLGEPVHFVPTDRVPASQPTMPGPADKPIPYNNMDYWHKP